MGVSEREVRFIVPKALIKAFDELPQEYIPLAWPGLWPVPLRLLLDQDFVKGLIDEIGDGEAFINFRPSGM